MSQGGYDWAKGWYAGRHVLVVGGSSGIGAGLARGFVGAGARVTLTGVTSTELAKLSDDDALAGANRVVVDVRSPDAVAQILGSFDSLDCLVNCAGVIRRGEEIDPDTFAEVVDINLNGTMRCCVAARPALARSEHGTILNLASMLSYFGGGLVPGYAASKGGITQLTKSLAIAFAPEGIRVNAIAPGWIETALTHSLRNNLERSSAILARTPLGRWGHPEDMVGAALFLCSPAAAFITGTILNVDGGYATV